MQTRNDDLVHELERLHFGKVEAQVYLSLLGRPHQNGSQIAKDLGIVRSSVYHALESLRAGGMVYLVPGSSSAYKAEDPTALMDRLSAEYSGTATSLRSRLASIQRAPEGEAVLNLKGNELFYAKVRQILLDARSEVYMNVCMDMEPFRAELEALRDRGVRVVVFSFERLPDHGLPMELYQHGDGTPGKEENRLMVVADMDVALVGVVEDDGQFFGTYSRNKLLVRLVAEHIHHDIYLLRLRQRNGADPVGADILLDTMLER